MSEQNVTELYRNIGKTLHDLGADQVILLSSRTDKEMLEVVQMQIALEGSVNKKEVEDICRKLWPTIAMEFMIHDESDGGMLYREMIEEGIRLF